MSTNTEEGEPTTLSPDDAFAVLGNETRMEILQTLGEADEPLPFSELREQVGIRDSGQFNYHLDKLDGHFITKIDGNYALRQAGRRVIEAVFTGAVTESPIVERTEIDLECPYCDAPVEMRFIEERVEAYCSSCNGTYGYSSIESEPAVDQGFLGSLNLPPAGIQGRDPLEIVEAGGAWANLEFMAVSSGICPRCSAPLEISVNVCEDHSTTDGLCDHCNSHHQVNFTASCTNCIFSMGGLFALALTAEPDFLSFQIDNGMNPVNPSHVSKFIQLLLDYDENVISTEPFEADFTFTLAGESITLTVDDELNVIDTTRSTPTETA